MARTALLALWVLLLGAAPALAASGQDQGNGLYGEAGDKVVTDAGFIIIFGFPVLILLLTLLQRGLDKRKYRRMKAAKARRARADERGGW